MQFAIRRAVGAAALVTLFLFTAGSNTCGIYGDSAPDAGPQIDAGAQQNVYHYVLVLDHESTDTGGMELDAIELIKGGTSYYADAFHECIQGPGIENVMTTRDCNQALGPPNNAAGDCAMSDTFFVNLGGVGGSLVASFSGLTEIETGDVVRVYECGAVADVYSVYIGTGTSASDTNWVPCLTNGSGVAECTVPALP